MCKKKTEIKTIEIKRVDVYNDPRFSQKVFDSGRLITHGAHEELLESSEVYRQLYYGQR